MIWTIISFVIIFTVVVVSHEFGHYLIARLNNIRVNEFSIGMGPAIFKKKGKHTTFAIRLLPIGGACIFEGEDGRTSETEDGEESEDKQADEPEEIDESAGIAFNDAPVWARIASVFAGPLFNIILAFFLSIFICWFCGSDLPVLYNVTEGLPAEAAGMQAGDKIVKINGERIYLWREVSMISILSSGKPMNITYERDGVKYDTTITPYWSEEDGRYYIGFIGGGEFVSCKDISVFKYAYLEVRYWLITTYRSLGYMFSGRASLDDLAGPVGVANVIDDTIEETKSYGLFTVVLNMVNIIVLLSVNLGVLNLIPFPALDGGRLVLLFIEAVTHKKIPPEKEGIFHMIGFILLMILMVVVLCNDIMRIFR